ncbi:MAG: hypothetical protein RID23_18715 [Roseovarius sp.]
MSNPTPRRRFLRTAAGLAALGVLSRPAQAAILTPRQTEGPFYPTGPMRRADIDNDLVRIAGTVRQAGGHIIRLTGRVLDPSGRPIPGARVEIWQCDAQGNYMHPRDRRSANHDPAFQGFGHDITDAEGRYTFRTIRPVPYPGRTPHIHVKALAPGREITTQFYLADEPANQRDGLFRRLSQAERNAVLMRFHDTGGDPQTTVDITL